MEKKEFPKDLPRQKRGEEPKKGFFKKPDIAGKTNAVMQWCADALKFIIGLAFLPLIYSFSVAFVSEFSLIERHLQNYFWAGGISLLLLYLFIWEPSPVYAFGHKLLEATFGFFAPLVKVAPYLLPIYVIVLFAMYGFVVLLTNSNASLGYFLFLAGAGVALHLVFSAKALRAKKADPLKASYMFAFGFVYVTNVIIIALCMGMVIREFSFAHFFAAGSGGARQIFSAVFKQLFVMQ